ncbi:MAG: hypothetical protein QOH26_1306 [Actinomycetota bacterium]|nr:hypothetical protein [Actinomycetota bacterium]
MARKNKRKRAATPGVDPNEKRRLQLEERRRQKADALAAQLRQQRRERIIRIAMIGLLAAGLFWFIVLRGGVPSEINGHTVQALSQAGVNEHPADAESLSYPTKPPVSGPHAGQPESCGVHDSQIADSVQVHSLEHGAVAIQYDPTLPAEQILQIEDIARGADENVLSAPYSGMETPIAVTAWGYLMRLDTLDEAAVNEFIDEFAGKGPESGQTCSNDEDQPFESPSPDGSPSAPAPSETPTPSG